MADEETAGPRLSAFALVRRLVGGFIGLAKLEIQHGRQEIGAMLAEAGKGAALVGIAIVVALISLATLDVVIVLGIAALFEVLPSLVVAIIILIVFVAFIVAAVASGAGAVSRLPGWLLGIGLVLFIGLIAAFALPAYLGFKAAWHAGLFVFTLQLLLAALIGWRGVRRIKIKPPEETIASVKEDVAWAKRLMKRG